MSSDSQIIYFNLNNMYNFSINLRILSSSCLPLTSKIISAMILKFHFSNYEKSQEIELKFFEKNVETLQESLNNSVTENQKLKALLQTNNTEYENFLFKDH